jgi:hypothetical protein
MNIDDTNLPDVDKLIQLKLLTVAVEEDSTVIKLTPLGLQFYSILSVYYNGKKPKIKKVTKPGEKKEPAMMKFMKGMAQFAEGMNQISKGLGALGGEPVKMDMSKATNFGTSNFSFNSRKQKLTRKKNGKSKHKR